MTELPVASASQTRLAAFDLLRRYRRPMARVLALNGLATLAALAGPWLLGRIVDQVLAGTTTGTLNLLAGALLASVLIRTGLVWFARRASFVVAESALAQLREEFMRTVTRLPLSTVERAGTGDLLSRTTDDIETLSYSVRYAVPTVVLSSFTSLVIIIALIVAGPLIAAALLLAAVPLVLSSRWYLRRARAGYLAEIAAYARFNGTLSETVDGARTVAALSLQAERRARVDDDVRRIYAAERYTLRLRTTWFPVVEFCYIAPLGLVLGWGGWLAGNGYASVGQVITVALYAYQLIDPLDDVINWLDDLQLGGASLARIRGAGLVPPDRTPTGRAPSDEVVSAERVRYAYRRGHDVLHGVDLRLQPGERLAVVGPSGAGKSTLGRLLAGIHPPRDGVAAVGGVPLVDLLLTELRQHVALVTQEQHVFVGTVAENLRLARPDADDAELAQALAAVDADGWVAALPDGLATAVGSGGHPVTPAQAQQLALARLVLLDPHTLVLDEATSLLDPRAARHLERSLSAVLAGRTVVAVAHRLHTAHDADRVAVVEDGRIVEIGSHAELVARGGSYAALWGAWHGVPVGAAIGPEGR